MEGIASYTPRQANFVQRVSLVTGGTGGGK